MILKALCSRHIRGVVNACAGAALLILCLSTTALADNTGITINGVTLPVGDSAIMHGGVAYVPMRSTFEKLGAIVSFAGSTATATMNGTDVLSATIGSSSAIVKGNAKTLDAPVYETGGRVYIPITALGTVFGVQIAHSATGWNVVGAVQNTAQAIGNSVPTVAPIAAAAPSGIPLWLWAIIILAVLAILWWLTRRPSVSVPSVPSTSMGNPLVATLLALIPTLALEHRIGLVGSMLNSFNNRGYNAQSFQNSNVDVTGARAGNVGATGDLIRQCAQFAPGGLRDAVANYAQSAPSFLTSLSPNLASSLRGLLGVT